MPVTPMPTRFGMGAQVSIRVRPQDDDAFEVICKAVMTPPEDWEVVGRVYPPGFIKGTKTFFKKLFGIKEKQKKPHMATPRNPYDGIRGFIPARHSFNVSPKKFLSGQPLDETRAKAEH